MNYISIIFHCIIDNIFEFFIITKGLNITFLVCSVHMTIIQDVGDS